MRGTRKYGSDQNNVPNPIPVCKFQTGKKMAAENQLKLFTNVKKSTEEYQSE